MSYEAFIWALGQEDFKAREGLLMICLAEHCNEERGYVWPGIKRLAKRAGMGQSTVERAAANLDLMGHIRVSRQFKAVGGARFSNRYYLSCFLAHPFRYKHPVTLDFHQRDSGTPTLIIDDAESHFEPIQSPDVVNIGFNVGHKLLSNYLRTTKAHEPR